MMELELTRLQSYCNQYKENFLYTYCFCEENIYHLAKALCIPTVASNEAFPLLHPDIIDCFRIDEYDYFVLFLSNTNKTIAIFQQKGSPDVNIPVVWDYHVILCARRKPDKRDENTEANDLIFDYDTRLPYPSTLTNYINEAFQPELSLFSRFRQ